jgi:hypothetical protein
VKIAYTTAINAIIHLMHNNFNHIYAEQKPKRNRLITQISLFIKIHKALHLFSHQITQYNIKDKLEDR